MNKISLKTTNPHLQDQEKYRQALITNVSSSTAIETGSSVEEVARILLADQKNLVRQPKESVQ